MAILAIANPATSYQKGMYISMYPDSICHLVSTYRLPLGTLGVLGRSQVPRELLPLLAIEGRRDRSKSRWETQQHHLIAACPNGRRISSSVVRSTYSVPVHPYPSRYLGT